MTLVHNSIINTHLYVRNIVDNASFFDSLDEGVPGPVVGDG